MTLVPEEMADPGVDRSFFLKPGIAYVRVGNFEANTAAELHKSIEDLGGNKLKGLLLDLRGNPGGLVESAVKTASFFLKPQQRILWIEGRDGPKEEVRVPEGFVPYDFPLALLVNSRTASAAELVAGALQDNNRATVLGEPSFGKALVQSVFELSEQTAVALTTARYLTPSGRQIQRPMGDCRVYQLNPCPKEGSQPALKTESDPAAAFEGGIIPNEVVYPRGYTRFEAAMEGSNSFLDFVQPYVKEHPAIDKDFEPDPRMLNDFQLFLSERRIRPALSEWSAHLDYIRNRLKQEVLNLTAGVARGDEIEAERDPQVQAALRVLTGS
jgi:carboxyl-terminal processing protease